MSSDSFTWICSFDRDSRTFTVMLAGGAGLNSNSWLGLRLDAEISDPDGNFEAYYVSESRSDSFEHQTERFHAKAVIRANRSGNPIIVHSAFSTALLGSPTLWFPLHIDEWIQSYIWITEDKFTLWNDDLTPDEWINSEQKFF